MTDVLDKMSNEKKDTGNGKVEKITSHKQMLSQKSANVTRDRAMFSTTNAPVVQTFSALSKNRSRSAYTEVLEKLKKDFFREFEKKPNAKSSCVENFDKIKILGAGSFGRVYLVKSSEKDTENYFAMKCIEKLRVIKLKQVDHTLNEKRILEAIRYPFIIAMECSFKDNSYLYFVMQFVSGGEMFTHLRKMKRFTEALSKFYASQVFLALEFLHYCDILYRDLKPENILIDEKGYIKIADLGFCKIVKGRTWTLCGTPEYIAPEIILSKGYGKAVDWWSFGVLLFEMNAGYSPFTSTDPMKVYERIVICKYKCPGTFTFELQDLIKNLLQLDLTRRFGNLRNGTQDIKNHKWFRDIDFLALYNKQIDPPFKPNVKNPGDTTHFDSYQEQPLKIAEQELFKEEFEMF